MGKRGMFVSQYETMSILKKIESEHDFMSKVEIMRKKHGLSINELCLGVGITRVMYWRLRSGKRCVILDFGLVLRFSKYLGFELMLYKEEI